MCGRYGRGSTASRQHPPPVQGGKVLCSISYVPTEPLHPWAPPPHTPLQQQQRPPSRGNEDEERPEEEHAEKDEKVGCSCSLLVFDPLVPCSLWLGGASEDEEVG